MRALVTGAHGTIGHPLCEQLRTKGWDVFTWNRKEVPVNDYYRMENFLKLIRPDVLFHLAYTADPSHSWLVNYEWSSELAWLTRVLHIKMVFTSTNLVFKTTTPGPITRTSIPDADSGYGFEKRKTEERIIQQNPEVIVARLGWQISPQQGGNNMVEFLSKRMKAEGLVRASINWLPACSFLDDTVNKLIELATVFPPSIYMLDSNEKWNLFQIATALSRQFGYGWNIEATDDYCFDSRMADERIEMPSLLKRLHL